MERNNLLFLIALVVGLGVAYFAVDQAYSTGRVVASSSCVDSDRGLDYPAYGYITFRNMKYYDYCSGGSLVEWYCPTKNTKASRRYTCSDGCYNGKCGMKSCTNECSSVNLKECLQLGNEAGYKICGNYNADSCLEWSSPYYCPEGYGCNEGLCFKKA